jgi:hypothetical protein
MSRTSVALPHVQLEEHVAIELLAVAWVAWNPAPDHSDIDTALCDAVG